MRRQLFRVLTIGAALSVCMTAQATKPGLSYIYPLKPTEGVFAYARISSSGRYLAYASEMPVPGTRAVTQTVVVVDLTDQRVLFERAGIDAYWSPDDRRLLFADYASNPRALSLWDLNTRETTTDVAPIALGDYPSWALREGRDLVLTIRANYFHLDRNHATLPASAVPTCPGVGPAERPLISKDGTRITAFSRGTIVVRNLTNCDNIIETGVRGAKADFSWDGKYIAYHTPKKDRTGYEIQVFDLARRTIRTVTDLPGSSLFPSWTKDGRLCFRYDSPEYRGFVMASNVLAGPERPAETTGNALAQSWDELFAPAPRPTQPLSLVLLWASWSAHSDYAVRSLADAGQRFDSQALPVGIFTAVDPSSSRDDVNRELNHAGVRVRELPFSIGGLIRTEAVNQSPTILLFRGDRIIDRRLGAQSADELFQWVRAEASASR